MHSENKATPAKCRVLIVEDEWLIASDLQKALESFGAVVVTLVGDIAGARALIADGGFDVGVLDVNLRGYNSFGLADELQRQGIPFVFGTGYSAEIIPPRFGNIARWGKPYSPRKLAEALLQLASDRQSGRT